MFDKKVEELEKVVDLSLQSVYHSQLALIREKAIKQFKSSSSEGNEYEAMIQVSLTVLRWVICI